MWYNQLGQITDVFSQSDGPGSLGSVDLDLGLGSIVLLIRTHLHRRIIPSSCQKCSFAILSVLSRWRRGWIPDRKVFGSLKACVKQARKNKLRLIELFPSTEIFSKRRKIYAFWRETRVKTLLGFGLYREGLKLSSYTVYTCVRPKRHGSAPEIQ